MSVFAFPSPSVLTIRRYVRSDAPATLRVFRDAVRRGAVEHYSEAKRIAWAPTLIDLPTWTRRRALLPTWVAERRGEVVGFSDLAPDGEIDMLYVHPEHTRSGIGGALLDEVERAAREADVVRLHTRASLVAQPLFKRRGFVIVEQRLVERHGEWLAQATMEKVLEPVA